MKILKLHKHNINCAECSNELVYLSTVNKVDGRYRHLYCAKIRRLHSGVMWWIKRNFI